MRSLVIGASGGIGGAMMQALLPRGQVVALSRSSHGIDLTDEQSIATAILTVSGPIDLIFIATGILGQPEKSLRAFTATELARQVAVNAAGPVLVLKHAQHLMPRDRRCVFAALSARVGSISDNALGGWYSYRAAKACLNQLLHTAAIELARTHPQSIVVGLHPGTVDTPFTAGYGHDKLSPAVSAARLLGVIDGLSPGQTGLCLDHAGQPIPW
ncbi:MAG: SDR family NAD(P)-dependent oxidoreductase [Paracoccaceae bacterium]